MLQILPRPKNPIKGSFSGSSRVNEDLGGFWWIVGDSWMPSAKSSRSESGRIDPDAERETENKRHETLVRILLRVASRSFRILQHASTRFSRSFRNPPRFSQVSFTFRRIWIDGTSSSSSSSSSSSGILQGIPADPTPPPPPPPTLLIASITDPRGS